MVDPSEEYHQGRNPAFNSGICGQPEAKMKFLFRPIRKSPGIFSQNLRPGHRCEQENNNRLVHQVDDERRTPPEYRNSPTPIPTSTAPNHGISGV